MPNVALFRISVCGTIVCYSATTLYDNALLDARVSRDVGPWSAGSLRHTCGTERRETGMATGDLYATSYVKAGRDGRRPRLCVTYIDPETGTRRERTRVTSPGRASALEREAEEWRAELNREWRELVAEEERRRSNPTVGECVDRYIEERRLDVRRGLGEYGEGEAGVTVVELG